MNRYETACFDVDIYERHVNHLFKPTGVKEIDLLRKYLIHDIRLLDAIVCGYDQVENANPWMNLPVLELMEVHQHDRENFDRLLLSENAFLENQYSKNKDVFLRAANFYLKKAYIRYGIEEESALDIVSKITGIPKEKLKEAQANNIEAVELEKCLKSRESIARRLYDFHTNTIHSEMQVLLEQANYESLDLEGKINAIEEALRIYMIRILHLIPWRLDYFRDFVKSSEELTELMAVYSSNPNNVWDVINYLVEMIGTLKKPFTIIWSEEPSLKEKPYIDTDNMVILVSTETAPIVVFKTIYQELFHMEYLGKDHKVKDYH